MLLLLIYISGNGVYEVKVGNGERDNCVNEN